MINFLELHFWRNSPFVLFHILGNSFTTSKMFDVLDIPIYRPLHDMGKLKCDKVSFFVSCTTWMVLEYFLILFLRLRYSWHSYKYLSNFREAATNIPELQHLSKCLRYSVNQAPDLEINYRFFCFTISTYHHSVITDQLILKSKSAFQWAQKYLIHYCPVLLIYTPWKHQETFSFSAVLRGYR